MHKNAYDFIHSVTAGASITATTLPVMNASIQTAKYAGANGISSIKAVKRIYNGSLLNLMKGIRQLAFQQSLRIIGKAAILSLWMPYGKQYFPGTEKAIAATSLTLLDGILTPVETYITRIYTNQPKLPRLKDYYRGTIPQIVRHGWIWSTYLATQHHINKAYSYCGFDPNNTTACVATSVPIAIVVSLPIQPFYVIEARRQSESAIIKPMSKNSAGLFKNVAEAGNIYRNEGLIGLFRGFPATVLGTSCLAVVANFLQKTGRDRKALNEKNCIP